jgi:hypothetical protein
MSTDRSSFICAMCAVATLVFAGAGAMVVKVDNDRKGKDDTGYTEKHLDEVQEQLADTLKQLSGKIDSGTMTFPRMDEWIDDTKDWNKGAWQAPHTKDLSTARQTADAK